MRALWTALVLVVATAAWADEPPPALSPAGLELDDVVIETAHGGSFHFTVELALDPAVQQRGLMFREEMAPDAGMLFVFDSIQPRSFWMHNTLIPLDMLFIAPDGEILNIAERTEPQTDDSHPSAGPVLAVLELNGGISALLGIAPGDHVIHEVFADTAN